MNVGVHVPQWGPGAVRRGVLDVARCAEAAGLDSVWVADHVVHPVEWVSVYPYRRGGLPFEPADGFLEGLTTLAVIAGSTDRVRLGTSVLLAAMREPLLTAKTIATLDVLSDGRVAAIAVGAGWWAEEFAALGTPFAERGERLDRSLAVLRTAWATGVATGAAGAEVVCEPRPKQPGGPPILIGGMGRVARRRAATVGDGWHAVGSDTDAMLAGWADVLATAAGAGRDPAGLTLSVSVGMPDDAGRARARVESLVGAGVGNAVLNFRAEDPNTLCRSIERFAADVLPGVAQGPTGVQR